MIQNKYTKRMRIDTELEAQAVRQQITRPMIARLLGKDVRSIYYYMKGQRSLTVGEALKLAELFRVPVETIDQWASMPAKSIN